MKNQWRFIELVGSVIVLLLLVIVGYFFYTYMSNQLTETLKDQAQRRGAIFAGSIKADIESHLIVPGILQQDERVAYSFFVSDKNLNRNFQNISSEIDNSRIYTVNDRLQVVNSSDAELLGKTFAYPIIVEHALVTGLSNYFNTDTKIYYSARQVMDPITSIPIGVAIVEIDFSKYQKFWNANRFNLALIQDDGNVILASDSDIENENIYGLLGIENLANVSIEDFGKIYEVNDQPQYLTMIELGLNNWKLIFFNSAAETDQLLRGYMALYALAAASIILFRLYLISRRAAQASFRLRRESEELRALNKKLVSEIEQRQKAEKSLQTAEQSLEQSSKLAVIGQMSAAIGHELNQPLAAMKTYLAGVRMLFRRGRFHEAGQSLNRIEKLMDRMGSITRQMRSFARTQESDQTHFDFKEALINAFELMTPQLGASKVDIVRDLPEDSIIVEGDQLRTEQILINLMRNAVEAVSHQDDAKINIDLLVVGEEAQVQIRDNGIGFEDVDKLFEPFYTTKAPGEGLGLGLAISAQYARDMGGNLLARENTPKGATFLLNLPLKSAN